jgi:hypothetical protein
METPVKKIVEVPIQKVVHWYVVVEKVVTTKVVKKVEKPIYKDVILNIDEQYIDKEQWDEVLSTKVTVYEQENITRIRRVEKKVNKVIEVSLKKIIERKIPKVIELEKENCRGLSLYWQDHWEKSPSYQRRESYQKSPKICRRREHHWECYWTKNTKRSWSRKNRRRNCRKTSLQRSH